MNVSSVNGTLVGATVGRHHWVSGSVGKSDALSLQAEHDRKQDGGTHSMSVGQAPAKTPSLTSIIILTVSTSSTPTLKRKAQRVYTT